MLSLPRAFLQCSDVQEQVCFFADFRTLGLLLSLGGRGPEAPGWAGPRCAQLRLRMRAAVGGAGTLFRVCVRRAECVERSTGRRRLAEPGGEAGAEVAAAAGGRGRE